MFIHALLFGSAVAFAQFGTGALWGHQDAMFVSLVGPAGEAPGSALQDQEPRGKKDQDHHAAEKGAALPVTQTAPPPEARSGGEEASAPDTKDVKGEGVDDANGHGRQKGEADTQFGLISPDQWSVITSAIERSKNYPRVARERGIQGVVHVRFRLKPSGAVEAVQVVKSSGYDVLDDASIRTVYSAAPMPFVKGWVEVPMAYVLK